MSHTDPIADMITRIRNAYMARHEEVIYRASNVLLEITKILKREGYIQDYEVFEEESRTLIRVTLRYVDQIPAIKGIKRESTPGKRSYKSKKTIPWIRSGMGTAVITTSQGILTDREARQKGIGGEIMFSVW